MIVTISTRYGSALSPVLEGLRDQLHYRIVNDELPTVVATRLGISKEAAKHVGAAPTPFSERILRGLTHATPEISGFTMPRTDINAEYVHAIEHAVREVAQEGNSVIVGRAGGHILRERNDVLKVFLHAPLPWRTARIMAALQCDQKTAEAEIARVDGAHETFAREYFKYDRNDAANYNLALDVSRFSIAGTVVLISTATQRAKLQHAAGAAE
jgi:cytidylate kinase